jgi:diguanylate cyclase (GGDEF)-like protein
MVNKNSIITTPVDPENHSGPQSKRGNLNSVWSWLSKPLTPIPTANDRRVNLLAWLLLFIFLLTVTALVLVMIVDPVSSPRHWEYVRLILGLDFFLAFAYGLNCAGHYPAAAGLTVACAFLGPWGSLILDPTIIQGDFVLLAYATLSILLSSILLSPLITAVLSVLQLVGLALIPIISSAADSINWESLLALIFFTSILSILSNILSQRNLEQIDRQAVLSNESEVRMRELSVRDHLTRLFNRRYLEETLDREIKRSLRSQHTIGIIIFDVDHFKEINDGWGHAAGDVVLQQLGQLSLTTIRGGDVACRYGGDEFLLVLPEASLDVTRERAEYLRIEARRLKEEYNSQRVKSFTISVGVAIYPDHGSTGDEILRSADKALYRAKSEGRDRVVVADQSI